MHRDLHRYLDGELALDDLSPELRAQAEEWHELTSLARLEAGSAPPWLESRVMASLPARPAAPWWSRAWSWLVEPRLVPVRPIGVLAPVAALVALVLALPASRLGGPTAPEQHLAGVAAANPEATVYVQFVFAAADAKSVQVAGDFNGWEPSTGSLRDPDGDGVWTGLVALEPGVHKYMFVVDGEQWVTDPRAERYVDDGFGMQNALIAIAPPAERSAI